MFIQCFISIPLCTGGCEHHVAVQSECLYVTDTEPTLQEHCSSASDQTLHGAKNPWLHQCVSGKACIIWPPLSCPSSIHAYMRIQWIEELVVQWHLPVTGRLLVQILLYALNVMCCVHGQGLLPSFCLMTSLLIFLINSLCVSG